MVGTCTHGDEALAFIQSDVQVDVVLMDIRMPICDGVQGTLKIKQSYPDVVVLILTTFDDDEYIVQALAKRSQRLSSQEHSTGSDYSRDQQ